MPETVETQVETTTETNPQVEPDEFDKERAMATIKKLREFEKEAEKLRKQVAGYEETERKRKEAEMTETDRLKAELDSTRQELNRHVLDNKKRAIALKVGLPEELARKLEGATDEELEADAKSLLAIIPKAPKAPTIPVTNPGTVDKAKTVEERKREIFGGPREVFDVLTLSPVEFPEGGSE